MSKTLLPEDITAETRPEDLAREIVNNRNLWGMFSITEAIYKLIEFPQSSLTPKSIRDSWIKVEDRLPPKELKGNDSVSCIVCDFVDDEVFNVHRTATAWYNYDNKEWYALYFYTPNTPVKLLIGVYFPHLPMKNQHH